MGEAHKGDLCADSSTSQLPAASVSISGNTQEHGVPCFLSRNAMFQVGRHLDQNTEYVNQYNKKRDNNTDK